MKVKLICIGKNSNDFVDEGVNEYSKRIKRYAPFELIFTKAFKKKKTADIENMKTKEGETVLKNIGSNTTLILLDERGKKYTSKAFSEMIQKEMLNGSKDIVFVIGGAYGFSQKLYLKSDKKISLSDMTYPHQLVRVMFLEQLYRAFTIINNEPYHNE